MLFADDDTDDPDLIKILIDVVTAADVVDSADANVDADDVIAGEEIDYADVDADDEADITAVDDGIR